MKRLISSFLILFIAIVSAQQKLISDIDFDGISDTIYIDENEAIIVAKISTKQFKKIKSQPLEITPQSFIEKTKNGFEFQNNWMRAGYANQFRYEKKEKRIRLIGMSRYEFGNAANDGSGESSVNLLTNDYIGEWNYFDHLANDENGELVKIPTIKTKMKFEKIYLEDFSDGSYFQFAERCSDLYYKHKEKEISRRKNKS